MLHIELAVVAHNLWGCAGETLIIIIILYFQLGPASLSGVSLVLLFFPLQGYVARIITKTNQEIMKETDHRVRLMSEILTAIKLIKLYAWEGCQNLSFSSRYFAVVLPPKSLLTYPQLFCLPYQRLDCWSEVD